MAETVERLPSNRSIHLAPTEHTRETLDNWIRWINDPDVRRWMHHDLPTSPESINKWLYNATHDPRRHYFTISDGNRQIGFVSIRQDQQPKDTGEIGIVIGEAECRGKGIGNKAVEHAMEYAHNTLKLSGIRALIKPDNEASIRLFTRQGFVQNGESTHNGVTMLRFENNLNEPNAAVESAHRYLREIGLTIPDGETLAEAAVQFARQLSNPASELTSRESKVTPPDPEMLKTRAGTDILVLKFSGTNLKIARGSIDSSGQPYIAAYDDGSPKMIKGTLFQKTFSSPAELWNEMFRLIDSANGTILPDTIPHRIAVIWALPGNTVRTDYGIDTSYVGPFPGELTVEGIEKIPVGISLVRALKDYYYPNQDLPNDIKIAVVNDTVSTLYSQVPPTDTTNHIGLVDESGFNFALKAADKTYNLQASSFKGIPLPEYAQNYATSTFHNTGVQCAGDVIGAQFGDIVAHMTANGLIRVPKSNLKLDAKDLAYLLAGDATVTEQKLGYNMTADERTILTDTAQLLRDRAAAIIGTLIGTTIHTFSGGFGDPVTIPTQGDFFRKTPGMPELTSALASRIAGKQIDFATGKNLDVTGAVAIAASL